MSTDSLRTPIANHPKTLSICVVLKIIGERDLHRNQHELSASIVYTWAGMCNVYILDQFDEHARRARRGIDVYRA